MSWIPFDLFWRWRRKPPAPFPQFASRPKLIEFTGMLSELGASTKGHRIRPEGFQSFWMELRCIQGEEQLRLSITVQAYDELEQAMCTGPVKLKVMIEVEP